MSKKVFVSKGPLETRGLGKRLAAHLEKGDVLALVGDLGSGKTTFVKGLAEGLGIPPDDVNSPSFVICKEYQGSLPLYHLDLHRMTGETDLKRLESDVGLADYLEGDGVTVIEWANHAEGLLPSEYLWIDFSLKSGHSRQLSFEPQGKRYQQKIGML